MCIDNQLCARHPAWVLGTLWRANVGTVLALSVKWKLEK